MEGYSLIVDDDPEMRRILSKALGDIGVASKVASDGEEALSHIKTEIPDLVLLDLMMPRMDGFEVLSRLKDNPATRDIPVIVVSSYTIGKEEMLKLLGVTHIIQKSDLLIAEVQAIVTDLLGGNVNQ